MLRCVDLWSIYPKAHGDVDFSKPSPNIDNWFPQSLHGESSHQRYSFSFYSARHVYHTIGVESSRIPKSQVKQIVGRSKAQRPRMEGSTSLEETSLALE